MEVQLFEQEAGTNLFKDACTNLEKLLGSLGVVWEARGSSLSLSVYLSIYL